MPPVGINRHRTGARRTSKNSVKRKYNFSRPRLTRGCSQSISSRKLGDGARSKAWTLEEISQTMLGASKRSPCATSAVADQHQQGYGELHHPEEPLIQHVPGRPVRGEHPLERQHGRR